MHCTRETEKQEHAESDVLYKSQNELFHRKYKLSERRAAQNEL